MISISLLLLLLMVELFFSRLLTVEMLVELPAGTRAARIASLAFKLIFMLQLAVEQLCSLVVVFVTFQLLVSLTLMNSIIRQRLLQNLQRLLQRLMLLPQLLRLLLHHLQHGYRLQLLRLQHVQPLLQRLLLRLLVCMLLLLLLEQRLLHRLLHRHLRLQRLLLRLLLRLLVQVLRQIPQPVVMILLPFSSAGIEFFHPKLQHAKLS